MGKIFLNEGEAVNPLGRKRPTSYKSHKVSKPVSLQVYDALDALGYEVNASRFEDGYEINKYEDKAAKEFKFAKSEQDFAKAIEALDKYDVDYKFKKKLGSLALVVLLPDEGDAVDKYFKDHERNTMAENMKTLTERDWRINVPSDVALAFRKGIASEADTLGEAIEGVNRLLSWFLNKFPDAEHYVDDIKAELSNFNSTTDRYADYEEYDDYDDEEDYDDIDRYKSVEDAFNEYVVNPLFDLCDDYNVWIPTDGMFDESLNEDMENEPVYCFSYPYRYLVGSHFYLLLGKYDLSTINDRPSFGLVTVIGQKDNLLDFAREMCLDVGDSEINILESFEDEHMGGKDYIKSSDDNYEKDKENERQVKLELAKKGIVKEDVSGERVANQMRNPDPFVQSMAMGFAKGNGAVLDKISNGEKTIEQVVDEISAQSNFLTKDMWDLVIRTAMFCDRTKNESLKESLTLADVKRKVGSEFYAYEENGKIYIEPSSPLDLRDVKTFDDKYLGKLKAKNIDFELSADKTKAIVKDANKGTITEDLNNAELSNNGLATVTNNLIQDEWQAIQGYNDAIVNFEAQGRSDLAQILKDILDEENIHVGQLQTILQTIDSSASNIAAGGVEAAEQMGVELISQDVVVENLNEEKQTCSICGKEYTGYGNNAQPVNNGKCCDECNATVVIPERLKKWKENK